MPDEQYPGVHIEETDGGPRPIEGVPTSVAALVGETERGPITPRLITSYADYRRWFGGVFDTGKYLPHAVTGFFENGGARAFVCRIVGQGAATAEAAFGDFNVRAAGAGRWGNRVLVKISDGTRKNADGSSAGFRLQLAYWDREPVPDFDPFLETAILPRPSHSEDFDNLAAEESSPEFYGRLEPALVVLERAAGAAAGLRPTNGMRFLTGGADGSGAPGVDDYAGLPGGGRATAQGLAALEQDACRDVALVYAPAVAADIAKAVVAHCEKMRFRFAVIDCEKGPQAVPQLNPRVSIADSGFAAFYAPWILAPEPGTGVRMLMPPGGPVLGVYARVDTERGVFKAPANEIVRGAAGLEFDITHALQDVLNPKGVNAIRSFPGRGIRVWGARTLASDALWKYVSVRRLFIFLERSIDEGTRWAVFEPNDSRLWARIADAIRQFLRSQWQTGALQGRTEQEAFFIRCDQSTMTQDDILNGRLVCLVGVAPVRPAEFVIFRIFQHTLESQP